MLPNLPDLRILPLELLVLHEDHDQQRTAPLIEKLRAQGILRNPPIVMPLRDGSGRYMVLDGANRVTSLQEMEFPHIVAQVVEADDPRVALHTWNHVIWGMSQRLLLREVHHGTGLPLRRINPQKSIEPPDCLPLHLHLADGRTYLICLPSDLREKIHALHRVVNCYKEQATFDRTSQTLFGALKDLYPDPTALVVFPRLDIQTVLRVVSEGLVLPTGITRFTVSPRVLHLNYPLHELSSGRSVEYKEAYLRQWVQERVKGKGVRYYAEATFLFDE